MRRKIGFVFQDFKLLNDRSIRDNLGFVLEATGWIEKDKRKRSLDSERGTTKMQGANASDAPAFQIIGKYTKRYMLFIY